MNWEKLKEEVEILVHTWPQRAAQARHAIAQIEAGLQELAKVGYSYEPVIKGIQQAVEEPQAETLSIAQAIDHVRGKPLLNPSMVEHESSTSYKSD